MNIKENLDVSTSEFWYDLTNGYINSEDICENEEDAKKVNEARIVIQEFESSCEEQIEGFIR